MTTTVGLSVTEAADVLAGVIYWLILLVFTMTLRSSSSDSASKYRVVTL